MLTSRTATLFESMGSHTVEIAGLCDQVLREPRPIRVADVRKLIEHAVYITDRAATGLVEEDLAMVKAAHEQQRAATELWTRINRELPRSPRRVVMPRRASTCSPPLPAVPTT